MLMQFGKNSHQTITSTEPNWKTKKKIKIKKIDQCFDRPSTSHLKTPVFA